MTTTKTTTTINVSDPCAEERTALRAIAGVYQAHPPVYVVDGCGSPTLLGDFGHWTTPSGKPVAYPNAYRRAFGRPVYHCSTLRVIVGRAWLYSWRRAGGVFGLRSRAA
jgi:hypothetical protein